MMNKLLEEAKTIPVGRHKSFYNENEIGLALSWAKGEITIKQMKGVLDTSQVGVYVFLAKSLKQHINTKD